MTAWYNEIDPYAAAWVRNLIAAGHIAPGIVDERSITHVQPDDLAGFRQVHFFAGIGGWSLAARIAGWPDDRPLWTGSCPCQPFSAAGKRKGTEDARHLWPEMRRLIAACRPDVVAGEQVASKDGRVWLAGVRTDLEAMGHDVWAADLCAAGVGAPHIRQRIWWLANAGHQSTWRPAASGQAQSGRPFRNAAGCGDAGRLADTDGGLAGDGGLQRGGQHGQQPQDGRVGGVGNSDVQGSARDTQRLLGPSADRRGEPGGSSFWSRYDVVHCTDAKARRFESGSFPLAHGVSNRVGRLRAYGNAINPWLAAEVLGAYLDGAAA